MPGWTYQHVRGDPNIIRRLEDGVFIPRALGNMDFDRYLLDDPNGTLILPAPAAPLVCTSQRDLTGQVRTTTAAVTEIARLTLPPQSVAQARLRVLALDAGNGNVKVVTVMLAAKRLAAGVVAGPPTLQVIATQQDTGAVTWAITTALSGNDVVVSVSGAVGRTIDWLLDGDMVLFAPGGL